MSQQNFEVSPSTLLHAEGFKFGTRRSSCSKIYSQQIISLDVRDIIEEITTCLQTVTEHVMIDSAKTHYGRFLHETEILYEAQQNKIMKVVEERLSHFKKEMTSILEDYVAKLGGETEGPLKKRNVNDLSLQRKDLVDSIVTTARKISANSRQNSRDVSVGDGEMSRVLMRLEEIESNLKAPLLVCSSLSQKLQKNGLEMDRIKEELRSQKTRAEEEVVSGLSGMWNIIGGIENKLVKLEQFNQKHYKVTKHITEDKSSVSGFFKSVF